MEWGFIWLMFALKIPIIALLWIVWWAVHARPETGADDDDAGTGEGGIGDRHRPPRPRPNPPRRRGPHGSPTTPAPPRVRTPGDRGRPVTR